MVRCANYGTRTPREINAAANVVLEVLAKRGVPTAPPVLFGATRGGLAGATLAGAQGQWVRKWCGNVASPRLVHAVRRTPLGPQDASTSSRLTTK